MTALNNLERVVSFGHQAVHRTAVTSKALIVDRYGEASSRNYFVGCSRGGGQALVEAQRHSLDGEKVLSRVSYRRRAGSHGLAALGSQRAASLHHLAVPSWCGAW